MFTAALIIIGKTWKQPKCPSVDEWIKKMKYIYTYTHTYTYIYIHTYTYIHTDTYMYGGAKVGLQLFPWQIINTR